METGMETVIYTTVYYYNRPQYPTQVALHDLAHLHWSDPIAPLFR